MPPPSVSAPPNLQKLGAELEAMNERLQALSLDHFPQHAGPQDAERIITGGPYRVEQAANQLVEIMEGPLADVANDPHAGKKQVRMAVAKLESFIRMLRTEQAQARDVSGQLSYDYGLELLADCWKELDQQVDGWVRKMIGALTCPESALSFPDQQVAEGRLMLDMRLLIDVPPSMPRLVEHLKVRKHNNTWKNPITIGFAALIGTLLFSCSE